MTTVVQCQASRSFEQPVAQRTILSLYLTSFKTSNMKDLTNVLYRLKPFCKLVGKPPIKVTTVYPPNWSSDSIEQYAAAVMAWRTTNTKAS